jgi:hypothetical protein
MESLFLLALGLSGYSDIFPMKRSTASIIGFLVAPLVPVVVMGALDPPHIQWSVLYFAIAAIVYANALATMLMVGVPTYFLFRRWSLIQWWSVPIVGFVVGGCVGYLYRLPFRQTPTESALIQGGCCALAGFVFWLIWRIGHASEIHRS